MTTAPICPCDPFSGPDHHHAGPANGCHCHCHKEPTMTTLTLDTSDIDQYLGKPLEYSPLREPIAMPQTLAYGAAAAAIQLANQAHGQ